MWRRLRMRVRRGLTSDSLTRLYGIPLNGKHIIERLGGFNLVGRGRGLENVMYIANALRQITSYL
jgi:hypothetical protein